MSMTIPGVASAEPLSTRQALFLRYFTAILIDLVVLNLFAEYWDKVYLSSFSFSLVAAVLLQVLLKATLRLEHRVAEYFNQRPGALAKFLRFFVAWLILFGSKFIILWALEFVVGDEIIFSGAFHGVVAFIVVVMVMLAAEEMMVRFYRRLA